jgi:hypothetical protein
MNQFLNERSATSCRILASALRCLHRQDPRDFKSGSREKFVALALRALAPAGYQQHFEVEPFAEVESNRTDFSPIEKARAAARNFVRVPASAGPRSHVASTSPVTPVTFLATATDAAMASALFGGRIR